MLLEARDLCMASGASVAAEQQRQQWLLQQLFAPDGGVASESALSHWLVHPKFPVARGLQAYRDNADAVAERALSSSYPTLLAMLGMQPFAAVARALWRAHPPLVGDLACWGEQLPAFLSSEASLGDWPYLADCARLDWALAQAERAPDSDTDLSTLALLGEADPDQLALDLAPGAALVSSPYPIVTLWQAHAQIHPDSGAEPVPDLSEARAALNAERGECALVWRPQWRARATVIDAASARFMHAALQGASLDSALRSAGEAFAFEGWLTGALQMGTLRRVRLMHGDVLKTDPVNR